MAGAPNIAQVVAAQGVTFTPIQEKLRRYIFYGVFVVLALLYFGIVTMFDFNQGPVSGFFMKYIVLTAPFVLQEIPLIGELVPAVLGGIIAATAPARANNTQLLTVLALSAFVYFAYLHMSVFLGSDAGLPITPGLREELEAQGLQDVDNALKVLASFASSVRNFAAFVFAALIGIKFNDARLTEIPFFRRRTDVLPGAAANAGGAGGGQPNAMAQAGANAQAHGNANTDDPPADDNSDEEAPRG